MGSQITQEQFVKVLPQKLKKHIDNKLINTINRINLDPLVRDAYRENILSYTSVLNDGKFQIPQYLDAVRYVSFKLMGDTNIVSYTKTFPDRYQRLIAKGTSDKDISSYVNAYNKTKLVNLIYEQTLIPTHVLNADMYQRALNVQAELMLDAKSEKVRSDAANSILTHLKRPETQKVELDIGIKEDQSIKDLRATTLELVAQQKMMLKAGAMTAKEVAHSDLVIEGECSNE